MHAYIYRENEVLIILHILYFFSDKAEFSLIQSKKIYTQIRISDFRIRKKIDLILRVH